MEQYNYDRRYSLSITQPNKTFFEVAQPLSLPAQGTIFSNVPETPYSFAYTPTEDYLATVNLTKTITKQQIVATIEGTNQTSGSDENKAKIEIYNLSEDTISLIAKKDNLVVLKAGYASEEDELPIVFSGQVIKQKTEKKGTHIITTLECGDGYTPITTARTSLRVSSGKTYRDVFLALAEEFNKAGVATGEIITDYGYLLGQDGVDLTPDLTGLNKYLPPQDIELIRGWSFTGKVSEALDDLCETFNHTWQIIHNRLFIFPKYYGEMVGSIILTENQIISLEQVEDGTQTGSNPAEYSGVKVKMLLDGRIDSSQRLRIENGDNAGNYPIRSYSHSLNYEGDDWYTVIECGGVNEN